MGLEEGFVRSYKKGDVIPEGAVFLDENSLLKIQEKKLKRLSKENLTSVLPLVYAPLVNTLTALTAGNFFLYHFRSTLNLAVTGKLGLGTHLLGIIIPSASIFGVYQKGIVPAVLSGKVECSICFETKLALLQTGIGYVYPLLLTWVFSAIEARGHQTYPVPFNFGVGSGQMLPFLRATAPKMSPMLMLLMGNISIAMGLGNQMQACYEKHFLKEFMIEKRELYSLNK
ncbi:uncharacterized protein [Argopecten irradians]|uniref:uncharacterized protein n=1 Tax=Argopecten irradians TaxID=31199 RepID=UPI00372079C7